MGKDHASYYISAEEMSSQRLGGILPPKGTKSQSQTARCCRPQLHTKYIAQKSCKNDKHSA